MDMPTDWRVTLEKGKTMDTATAIDQLFEAYNNASYDTVHISDLSAEELADFKKGVKVGLEDGPGSLPYILVQLFNTSDWKPWQYIQMTQELS
jgi:hypothetical protein